MSKFDVLVGEQLKTMDRLLELQNEVERCQKIERELERLQKKDKLMVVQEEIQLMKAELHFIQQTFERQTEDVIRSYKNHPVWEQ
ncbi:YgaB family protein [Metabacillus sp. 84]|uniref:YgaB family protein n=1 Tax=unclassified Metabacillus TaxID=2675274 RepID=UPI003CEF0E46